MRLTNQGVVTVEWWIRLEKRNIPAGHTCHVDTWPAEIGGGHVVEK